MNWQITEKTAKLLGSNGLFRCEKKGETFLKGKGYVMTYFARPVATDLYCLKKTKSIALRLTVFF